MKFFASYREAAGISEEVFEAPWNATVKEVIEAVVRRYPRLGPMEGALYVLSQNIVDPSTKIKDGDTLAIFPLVGGG